ncbi:hypothetical protein [Ideonella paludis]|uniref:hypothetical protein n=1 Tax=Ideonella paludis TaxID=1233411 RepID=UPI003632EE3C
MCTQPSHIFSGLTAQPAETHFSAQPLRTQTPCVAPPRSSRRARIWELPHHALCPVIGVCLPLTLLRKLVGKAVGGEVQAIDYELHCGVINECKQRSAVSQRVQDALDERYRLALQRHRTLKDTPALADTWRAGLHSPDIAAIFWSVVTHPACDAPLLEQVLQDVHMLQHQVGMMQRVESERFQDLLRENAVLGRELAGAQSRSARQAAEFARQVERLEASQLRLRGELLQRDTLLAQALDEVTQLKSSVPDLEPRLALTEDKRWLTERLESTQRALQAAQWRIQQLEARSVHPPEAPVAASQIGLPDDTESLPNLTLKETQGRPKFSCPSVGDGTGKARPLGAFRRPCCV